MQHRTREGAPQSRVNFLNPRAVRKTARVLCFDTAAGHDHNPAFGFAHQLRDRFLSLKRCRFASGGEQSTYSGGTDVFECAKQVGSHVEGAMESDGERTCQICKLAG